MSLFSGKKRCDKTEASSAMASDPRFFDMTNGGQAAGGNMTIGGQFAGGDMSISGQRAGVDMTIGSQAAGRNLTIAGKHVVQSAGRMAEVGFDKVVGAIAVVLEIIFRIVKAVFVADCDPPSSEEVNKKK